MAREGVSRRALLKSLSVGVAVGSVMRVIPLHAAEHAHGMIAEEQASGPYTPKYFDAHGYKTLRALCDTIIPADAEAGGALEGGAPEFIDLLTSENTDYQEQLAGLLKWLDATCTSRFGKAWVDCAPAQQTEVLDRIAYRKNADADPSLAKPVEWFAFLRSFTSDGYFTSKVGIRYVGYKGNTYLTEFPGCPPVPGV
jgi:hypothetical protein